MQYLLTDAEYSRMKDEGENFYILMEKLTNIVEQDEQAGKPKYKIIKELVKGVQLGTPAMQNYFLKRYQS